MIFKVTAVKAPDRLNYIESWIGKTNIDKDPILKQFNIEVNLRPVELGGRVLEAPDLQYGGGAQPAIATSRSIAERGQWDHRNFKLANPKKISKWVVLNCSGRVRDNVAWVTFIISFYRILLRFLFLNFFFNCIGFFNGSG